MLTRFGSRTLQDFCAAQLEALDHGEDVTAVLQQAVTFVYPVEAKELVIQGIYVRRLM